MDHDHQVTPNSMSAFFRNNHFSVLFNKDGELYLLLTDQGYADVPGAVWERLCEVRHRRVRGSILYLLPLGGWVGWGG